MRLKALDLQTVIYLSRNIALLAPLWCNLLSAESGVLKKVLCDAAVRVREKDNKRQLIVSLKREREHKDKLTPCDDAIITSMQATFAAALRILSLRHTTNFDFDNWILRVPLIKGRQISSGSECQKSHCSMPRASFNCSALVWSPSEPPARNLHYNYLSN